MRVLSLLLILTIAACDHEKSSNSAAKVGTLVVSPLMISAKGLRAEYDSLVVELTSESGTLHGRFPIQDNRASFHFDSVPVDDWMVHVSILGTPGVDGSVRRVLYAGSSSATVTRNKTDTVSVKITAVDPSATTDGVDISPIQPIKNETVLAAVSGTKASHTTPIFEWNWGDRSTVYRTSEAQSSHTFADSGTYTLEVSVRDSAAADFVLVVRQVTIPVLLPAMITSEQEEFDFGDIDVGAVKVQEVQVVNRGGVPGAVTLLGDSPFALVSDSLSVQPGPSTISVFFRPDSPGDWVDTLAMHPSQDVVLIGSASAQNRRPTAVVNSNYHVLSGDTVLVDGQGSFDSDGDSLRFNWTQVTGTPLAFDSSAPSVSFLNLPTGIYKFRLEVSDGSLSHTDSVTATVVDLIAQTGVRDGPDSHSVRLGDAFFELRAVGDIQVEDLTFTWQQLVGIGGLDSNIVVMNDFITTPVLLNTYELKTKAPTVQIPVPPLRGMYLFALVIEDSAAGLISPPDTLVLNVRSQPPQVEIIGEGSVFVGNSTILTAEASDDMGDTLLYSWIGDGATYLSSRTTREVLFEPPSPGTYSVAVMAQDGDPQSTLSDPLQITVPNRPPIALVSRSDILTTAGGKIDLDATFSVDPDGSQLLFLWTQIEGPATEIVNSRQPIAQPELRLPGRYVFSATVSDGELIADPPASSTVVVTHLPDNETPAVRFLDSGPLTNIALVETTLSDVGPSEPISLTLTTDQIRDEERLFFDFEIEPPDAIDVPTAYAFQGEWFSVASVEEGGTPGTGSIRVDTFPGAEGASADTLAVAVFETSPAFGTGDVATIRVTRLRTSDAELDLVLSLAINGGIPTNREPIADAGQSFQISLDEQIFVSGSASTDADGDSLSFEWSQTSGPGAILLNSNLSEVELVATSAGTYELKLVVSDGKETSEDRIQIVVTQPDAPGSSSYRQILNGPYVQAIEIDGTSFDVGGERQVSFSLFGEGLSQVRQIDVRLEFTPPEAFDLESITVLPPAGLLAPGFLHESPTSVRAGMASLSAFVLSGDASLGSFSVTTTNVTSTTPAEIKVTGISVGPSSTVRQDEYHESLGFTIRLNGGFSLSLPQPRLFFTSDRSGNTDIWSMDLDGADLRQITYDPASDGDAVLSPDGTRLAFSSTRRTGSESDVYVLDLETSELVNLTADNDDRDDTPAWSPDGTELAFTSTRGDYTAIWKTSATTPSGASQVTFPGQVAPIEGDLWPDWSPDGNRILYMSTQDHRDLWDVRVFDLNEGTDDRIIERFGGNEYSPRFSPSGELIAWNPFPSSPSSPVNIWLASSDGTDRRALTTGNFDDFFPSWGVQGSDIYFTSDRGGNRDIWVVDLFGNLLQLTDDTAVDTRPSVGIQRVSR
ncbi:MAG: hypothetical protein HN796_09915 [Gemmatimonadetes bacterium]|nr:hypothetical protein [Gemmatimonadota bacterium]